MQRAQPVLAAHYWLCYCEKLRARSRPAGRLPRAGQRARRWAPRRVAGTSLPIDRHDVARRLGFDAVAANSIDVSSDRDFVIEFAFALTLIAEHLSTWAEEWILWSTSEFNFLKLPQAFCTGSSIMPQKVNPDVLELIRGKTARVVGNLHVAAGARQGLPLAYNRDLQEDKERIFDSFDTVRCLSGTGRAAGGRRRLEPRGHCRAARSRPPRRHDADGTPDPPRRRRSARRTASSAKLVRRAARRRCGCPICRWKNSRPPIRSLDAGVYDVLGPDDARWTRLSVTARRRPPGRRAGCRRGKKKLAADN